MYYWTKGSAEGKIPPAEDLRYPQFLKVPLSFRGRRET